MMMMMMVMIIMMMERLESVRWGGAPVTDCRLGSRSHESWFSMVMKANTAELPLHMIAAVIMSL